MALKLKEYRQAHDKEEYICGVMNSVLSKKKLSPTLSLQQLTEVMDEAGVPLSERQSSELYIYATYKEGQALKSQRGKINGIVGQGKSKVDVSAISVWVHAKIKSHAINFNKRKVSRSAEPRKNTKLPIILPSSSDKLKDELRDLINIFEEMEKERQNSGLIPLNENQDNEVEVPSLNIPYDSQLAALNNSLCKLRIKAEERLVHIIDLARSDNRIRHKLEDAIEKFQEERIKANEKVGRLGALRARERLAKKKRDQEQRIRELDLGQRDDIVRAARLHALLSLPQIKPQQVIY